MRKEEEIDRGKTIWNQYVEQIVIIVNMEK